MSANAASVNPATRDSKPELAPVAKAARRSLNIVSAADLPATYAAPDELVQGLLTTGGNSMLYGDSHCGKTFLAIDLAIAIASGTDWMGRRVEQGLVLYLAAESPESVRSRLQAYQKHYGIRVPNLFIVQKPINLFVDDADTEAIIEEVKMMEAQHGLPVRLIVGDTLARLSAGANENMGQDMGRVIARIDRIRSACSAHFMLIHHIGKNPAAGARGWNGVRAAVDVEIEVTEQAASRCAEVTKNRDLGSKGERIGFTLDVVELGTTKWGKTAATCVVVPAAAPERRSGPRLGKVESKIMAFLRERKAGAKKADVVAHLKGDHPTSTVYRAVKNLVTAGHLHEADDVVSITGSAT
jgi:KaiC/GvpD/RAD55 family RecA-like ATPase